MDVIAALVDVVEPIVCDCVAQPASVYTIPSYLFVHPAHHVSVDAHHGNVGVAVVYVVPLVIDGALGQSVSTLYVLDGGVEVK